MKMKILLIAIALIAMIGSAAAQPETIEILDGGTLNLVPDPMMLMNDGTSYPVDLYFSDYRTGYKTAGLKHELVVTLAPNSGVLAAGELTLKLKEKENVAWATVVTSTAGSSSVVATLTWYQDDDGATSAPTDVIGDNVNLIIESTGIDGRDYYLTVADDLYDLGAVIVDSGAEAVNVNNVPEFPTIALPIAAILGLAFIFQRRREED